MRGRKACSNKRTQILGYTKIFNILHKSRKLLFAKRIYIICIPLFIMILFSCLYFFLNNQIIEWQERETIDNIFFHFEDQNRDLPNRKFLINISGDTLESESRENLNSNIDEIIGNNADSPDKNHVTQVLPEGFDCIITIPAIDLEKIVYTGTVRNEHLENYGLVTSAADMQYINGGNYIICGHSSRIYGHSLNRLKELKVGDEVYIRNRNVTDSYAITSVTFEVMKDTSKYCKQTDEDIITILSCAKYIADNKYIVIKCRKI